MLKLRRKGPLLLGPRLESGAHFALVMLCIPAPLFPDAAGTSTTVGLRARLSQSHCDKNLFDALARHSLMIFARLRTANTVTHCGRSRGNAVTSEEVRS